MTTPLFTVTTDGLTATVDALTPIVEGVTAYFANPARGIATPVPVYPGSWEQWRNTSDGPPGRVIIDQAEFRYFDAGQWPGPSGLRYAPGDFIDIPPSIPGHPASVEVVAVRGQIFKVIVLGLAAKGAPTDDVGGQYALDQQVAAFALADLTYAALRNIHGHPLGPMQWTPMGEERGEHAYGAVLVGSFGPIPIPVLGDIVGYLPIPGTSMSATVLIPPATTGDTVTAP